MKIIFLIVLFCVSNLSAQQYYYTFSELNGIDDQSGNTHLFYRLYTFQRNNAPLYDYISNSVYHLDIQNNTDTLFLWAGQTISGENTSIADIEFWNNDPSKFIYSGDGSVVDPVAFIQRFDQSQPSYSNLGQGFDLELGKQNDSLVFASLPILIKSTDGGFTWDTLSIAYFFIVSISNYSDDEIFFRDHAGSIYKSLDGGATANWVDTSNSLPIRFFYDSDSMHIYNLTNNSLRVSNNRGNAFSWTNRYSSFNRIYLSIEYSQSGKIYLADGRKIYVSDNYGLTFNEYKVLDRKIVGIYKKPNSDKLYAATKYDLYEITPDTIVTMKHLNFDLGLLDWFPLTIGNIWAYNSYSIDGIHYEFTGTKYMAVTKDTVIENKKYFVVENDNLSIAVFPPKMFIRIDSSTGFIYRYWQELNGEYIFHNLNAEVGDTIPNPTFPENPFYILIDEQSTNYLGIDTYKREYREYLPCSCYHILIKGFGLATTYFNEFSGEENILKGCVINGLLYGDTTLVGIDDIEDTPLEFHLSQNYPNPFNPSTKISWQSPVGGHQTLKVFDVLGREVATLVNEFRDAGSYEIEFDTKNLASGVYYYQLNVNSFIETKKMIYLK